MDRRFAADEWEGLTIAERIRRCTILAEEAQKLAETASASMRVHYLKFAEQWLELAHEMARDDVQNSTERPG
jgi:hypothetical protein